MTDIQENRILLQDNSDQEPSNMSDKQEQGQAQATEQEQGQEQPQAEQKADGSR